MICHHRRGETLATVLKRQSSAWWHNHGRAWLLKTKNDNMSPAALARTRDEERDAADAAAPRSPFRIYPGSDRLVAVDLRHRRAPALRRLTDVPWWVSHPRSAATRYRTAVTSP